MGLGLNKINKTLELPSKKALALVDYVGGLTYLAGVSFYCFLTLFRFRNLVAISREQTYDSETGEEGSKLKIQPNLKPLRDTMIRSLGQVARIGAAAIPIAGLIVGLVSLSVAVPAVPQLKNFGGNIFIADILAVGLCSQMVPLILAILVAGRSGTRMAAEIGTMKVTEEVTAMRAMGMDVVKILVLPRLIGMMVAMPLLVMLGDAIGLTVGSGVGKGMLDLTFNDYFRRVLRVLRDGSWFSQGLYKSILFAAAISLVSCYRGFKVRGGAEAVGAATTQSDVDAIVLIIGINTVFTIINTFS